MSDYSIGIYIPTKNRLDLLKKALDSIFQQTYKNYKICVVDDGSSDGTYEYLSSLKDPRVSFIRNEKSIGACAARNKAIEYLDTDLVTGLDDDDIFLPNRLEELISVYDEKYAFVCSGYFWDYGTHKKSLFTKDKVISLSDALDLNQCSNQVLVSRKRALAVSGFDPKLPALQDHDMWVRLIAKFGNAYRLGKELYVVNDDRALERISSVTNKLKAIELFEKKHKQVMTRRNQENFAFYRKKITGDKISFMELLTSSKYGLSRLKLRHVFAQSLESLSKSRLSYMAHGKVDNPKLNWMLTIFAPLIATGGPGASRVILLSSCIYFLGASNTASFGSDFFILMLLNTMFSQSFGFFILKPEYLTSFKSILKQSLQGVATSSAVLVSLYYAGVVSNLTFTLPLLLILHFYYVYRFKRVANHGFVILAVAESLISFICLIVPILFKLYEFNSAETPYLIYTLACLSGLAIVYCLDDKPNDVLSRQVPIKQVVNIGVSTSASIFAVFCFPLIAKLTLDTELASYVALSISCFSIAMLIPRTFANKSMKLMASSTLSIKQLVDLNQFYSRLILISCSGGLLFTASYLYVLGVDVLLSFTIPTLIMVVFACSQFGFVNLTSLSLHGEDGLVAKLNLFVLVTTLLMIAILIQGMGNVFIPYIVMFLICCGFIIRNMKAKMHVKALFSKVK